MKTAKKKKYTYKVHQIALNCTTEELSMFEAIKQHHQRKTDSDCIRFLIKQESEKILKSGMRTGIKGGVHA